MVLFRKLEMANRLTLFGQGTDLMDVNWHELFALSVSPIELIVRGSAMYWFLFLIFRFVLKHTCLFHVRTVNPDV